MPKYLLNRLWQSALTLVLASIVVFVGIRMIPGDPALAMAGEEADPEMIAATREKLGLDKPIIVQYFAFIANMFRGDFGNSVRTGAPVSDLIGATLPVTLWLATYAIVIAVIVGVLVTLLKRLGGARQHAGEVPGVPQMQQKVEA